MSLGGDQWGTRRLWPLLRLPHTGKVKGTEIYLGTWVSITQTSTPRADIRVLSRLQEDFQNVLGLCQKSQGSSPLQTKAGVGHFLLQSVS